MVDEIVGGIFKVLGRFIGQFFIEIIFEILLKGPGYFISKQFTKNDPDPDGFIVVLTGFFFWLFVGGACYALYNN
jgi:hypothetical protein